MTRQTRPAALRRQLIAFVAAAIIVAALSPVARAADPEPVVTDISAGTNHACALLDDGRVACWGSNFTGALGTGDRYTRIIPSPVDLPKPATAVAAGGEHTCALLADRTVSCWGRNWEAQLGTGSDSGPVARPVPVAGLDSVVAIGSGQNHTCALRADATAWCWGNGGNGQIGPAWDYGMTAPVQITGVGDVAGLSVGLYHTCLRLDGGPVSCFGFYPRPGDEYGTSAIPTPVPGLSGAVALDGGEAYECGVMPDGTVRCFGLNYAGQLGDGTFTTHPFSETAEALGIDTAVDIAASSSHVCALLADGTASCWGYDNHGELGTPPSEDGRTPVPQPVPGIDGITAIDTGWGFTCAVVSGTGTCWGRNDEGQLGDRTVAPRRTPAPLSWVADPNAPRAGAPAVAIRLHREVRKSRVEVAIRPSGADDPGGTGIDHFELQVSRDGGETWSARGWQTVRFHRSLPTNGPVLLRVRAVDRVGNVSAWRTARVRLRLLQESAAAIRYRGDWTTASGDGWSGGSGRFTTDPGASATLRFTGTSVALVSRQGPSRGAFRVYVDGAFVGKAQLQDRYEWQRRVVFRWRGTSSSDHVLRLVAAGSARVDLDAFVVQR